MDTMGDLRFEKFAAGNRTTVLDEPHLRGAKIMGHFSIKQVNRVRNWPVNT
jgi:hypothetical protein